MSSNEGTTTGKGWHTLGVEILGHIQSALVCALARTLCSIVPAGRIRAVVDLSLGLLTCLPLVDEKAIS